MPPSSVIGSGRLVQHVNEEEQYAEVLGQGRLMPSLIKVADMKASHASGAVPAKLIFGDTPSFSVRISSTLFIVGQPSNNPPRPPPCLFGCPAFCSVIDLDTDG